jgi:hypothetical protein
LARDYINLIFDYLAPGNRFSLSPGLRHRVRELSPGEIAEEGAFDVQGAASSRISGADDAEIARIDLGNHAFSEDFALRQG